MIMRALRLPVSQNDFRFLLVCNLSTREDQTASGGSRSPLLEAEKLEDLGGLHRTAGTKTDVGVTRKIRMSLRTREGKKEFLTRLSTELEHGETVISSADCTSSQKSESVYTCPRAPFYREMKGLLHTENTLSLREYS
jgi:hypothetical protein